MGCYFVAAVTTAACQLSRRAAVGAVGVLFCGLVGSMLPASFLEPAYAASFYAPAEPYSAASVARGSALYSENCVSCHGLSGSGDGPAAVGLRIRPANLTEPHLFAHSPADLFRWVSRGRANGAMPGFAAELTPGQRWDVISFIRARAAGVLVREFGGEITAVGYPIPEFAFEADGVQGTLRRMLATGTGAACALWAVCSIDAASGTCRGAPARHCCRAPGPRCRTRRRSRQDSARRRRQPAAHRPGVWRCQGGLALFRRLPMATRPS